MSYFVRVRGLTRTPWRISGGRGGNTISTVPVLVDLDDGNTRRRLQNERARFIILPEVPVAALLTSGAVGLVTTSGGTWVAPVACNIIGVVATVGTAPTGADMILDIHRVPVGGAGTDAGVTIFTVQANRPTIAATTKVSPLAVPDVKALAAGDILRVEVDQVGSSVAGSDLSVQFYVA